MLMSELPIESSSNAADTVTVKIQSVCSQNRYLTVTGVNDPLRLRPPEFLPTSIPTESTEVYSYAMHSRVAKHK